ncbi:MAG: GMC family oxidoreductase [Acidimicrobiia bacterium]|nr:GMC family oxidoreductase [Acidimicrobiia bacterium]
MITDARTLPVGTTVEVDLCVIGGGPAGISVAHRFLEQDHVTVAVIESGGTEFDPAVQELATTDQTGQPYYPIKETRIRAFGGSTMSWGGISAPFDELDFEERDWVPRSGWPISRSDLDPYYTRAKQVGHVLNPDASSVGEGRFGEDNGPSPATKWAEVYFSGPTRYGATYEDAFRRSKRVSTLLYSTVVEIETDDAQTHVTGVRVATHGGGDYRVVAKQFVLAGGGIENARMLMTSGNVERGGLANQHDVVGRYFQEHPGAKDKYRLPEDSTWLASRIHGAAGTLNFSRLGLTAGVQRNEQLVNYLTNISFGYEGQLTEQFQAVRRIVNASRKPWSDSPYLQDVGGGPNKVRMRDVGIALRNPYRSVQSAFGARFEPKRLRRFLHIESNVEQIPTPENRVTLTRDVDAFGIPRASLHWQLSDLEERTYRRGLDLVIKALDQYAPGLREGRMDYPEPWPGAVHGNWHHIGTTRMHPDPKQGVVDADCKIHGIDNLHVAGSSVFPTGGATSPTLTIVALGLRLSDHLAELLQR